MFVKYIEVIVINVWYCTKYKNDVEINRKPCFKFLIYCAFEVETWKKSPPMGVLMSMCHHIIEDGTKQKT